MIRDFFLWYQRKIIIFPFLIIVLFGLGRALGNVSLFLYVVAGSVCLAYAIHAGRDFIRDRVVAIYIIFSFLLLANLVANFDKVELGEYAVFWLSTLTFIFLYLWRGQVDAAKVGRAVFLIMAFRLGMAAYDYSELIFEKAWRAAVDVNVMSLAMMLPLAFLIEQRWQRYAILFLGFLALLFADSRTELVAAAVAVMCYGVFLLRKAKLAMVVTLSVLITFFSAHLWGISHGWYDYHDVFRFLSNVSTTRTDLWLAAWSQQPENILLGGGLEQSAETIKDFPPKHLHNVLLELYWELGISGFIALVLLTAFALSGVVDFYRADNSIGRKAYAVLLSLLVSVFIGCLLDKGMNSVYFNFFYFSVLGIIWQFKRREGVGLEFLYGISDSSNVSKNDGFVIDHRNVPR